MKLHHAKGFCWSALAAIAVTLASCDLNSESSAPSPSQADGADGQLAISDTAAAASGDPDVAKQDNGMAAAPQALFSPALLDFGAVEFGECAVKTVALSNWGTAPLTVEGLELTALGPQFQAEWLSPLALAGKTAQGGAPWLLASPLVVQAYQSAGLSLRFCPSKAGPLAVKVPLLSNGGPLALAVQATGVKTDVPCFVAAPKLGRQAI